MSQPKTRTDAFAADMVAALGTKCGLEWHCGKPTKGNRECVDVIGSRNKKDWVLIEVELRRGTPLGNVVKVWSQISRETENGNGRLGKKVILFQAFSRFYQKKGKGKKGTKRSNAEFVGHEMASACRRVSYIPLSMDYFPARKRPGRSVTRGGRRRKYHATKLARRIVSRLRALRF